MQFGRSYARRLFPNDMTFLAGSECITESQIPRRCAPRDDIPILMRLPCASIIDLDVKPLARWTAGASRSLLPKDIHQHPRPAGQHVLDQHLAELAPQRTDCRANLRLWTGPSSPNATS